MGLALKSVRALR